MLLRFAVFAALAYAVRCVQLFRCRIISPSLSKEALTVAVSGLCGVTAAVALAPLSRASVIFHRRIPPSFRTMPAAVFDSIP